MFGMSDVPERLPPPSSDFFSPEQLSYHNGITEPTIYIAVKGTVFDVTRRADKYGQGKAYHLLVGRDCSLALAKGKIKLIGNVTNEDTLTEKENKSLDQWYDFFVKRYKIVGIVVSHDPS